jgi:glyoxylase-like metal-dependent hydrolase (beta-lactamase superfamily II)
MVERGEEHRPSAADDRGNSGWEQLTEGVVRRRLPRWDATAGAVRGTDGLMVVDTGSSLGEGALIGTQLRDLFALPVTHAVLTHAHFDHVLGAGALGDVRVYGADGLERYLAGAREELRRDAVGEGLPDAEASGAVEALVCPRHTVGDELSLTFGGRRVLLKRLGPAHSEHDLVVLVHGSGGEPDVVFCGDLVEESGEPQAGPDARPELWPQALERLLALGGEDALYVPGHGAVVDAAFVRAQRDVLARRFA